MRWQKEMRFECELRRNPYIVGLGVKNELSQELWNLKVAMAERLSQGP
ncbi:MAG: hypothetical protein V1897_11085 [Pseudomonadota bacterium]